MIAAAMSVRTIAETGFSVSDIHSSPFYNLVYTSSMKYSHTDWADPASWPDSQALIQAVATNDGGSSLPAPDLIVIYGFWIPEQLDLNGIRCHFDIRNGSAEITYYPNRTEVVEAQSPDDIFTYLSDTYNCTPWDWGYDIGTLFPENSSLWSKVLNGSDAAAFYSVAVHDHRPCSIRHQDFNSEESLQYRRSSFFARGLEVSRFDTRWC
jgi:hypothetical protein